jgi:hypothetical protein
MGKNILHKIREHLTPSTRCNQKRTIRRKIVLEKFVIKTPSFLLPQEQESPSKGA